MPMHNDDLRKHQHSTTPETHHGNQSRDMENSVREGYELTDVSVQGVLVFLLAMAISLGVFFVFCFGMGKVINNALMKHDGPPNQWNRAGYVTGKGRNMESNPAIEQQQLRQLTQSFPTPRLQGDDGDRDTADLHAREDLLLENYSWVDRSKGTVRIPIERAMQLIAQRGLPVESKQEQAAPLMAGDRPVEVTAPLTDGFARTAYEQELRSATMASEEQASSHTNHE
jgi:hypothetical protein